ncbi:hypothetical protein VNO78_22575 [Psophocarpus tetragonolobus]|uniref:Uncharacterized protein n=1 Tax=Psophocarpus tetragonolobus TaxID=3891 RepID=A0AAN9S540_PSOTE
MLMKACKMATSIVMHRFCIQCTNTYLSLDAFNVNSGSNHRFCMDDRSERISDGNYNTRDIMWSLLTVESSFHTS